MSPNYSIFYSWQSDLPKETNLNAIRECIKGAIIKVKADLIVTRIDLNEATTNEAGSPDIASSIFEKIETCDIFVCDLTTINFNTTDKRRVPSPNVLIELGYASAVVGWERIIMVFNKVHGEFPKDLPFDIDRRRVTPYIIKDKSDKSGMGQLTVVLKEAIKTIMEKSPLRPSEKKNMSPEQRMREYDIKYLKLILSTINIPTFDLFIHELPDRFLDKIYRFYNFFNMTINSSSFHIYDEKLSEKLRLLKSNWSKLFQFENYYIPVLSGTSLYFMNTNSGVLDGQLKQAYDEINLLKSEVDVSLKDLLSYVRLNYLEIDIEETSNIAYDNSYKGETY